MKKINLCSLTGVVVVFTIILCLGFTSKVQQKCLDNNPGKATIILVHGAFADGSSWNKVIPVLQRKGYITIAVQNPLTSLNDDVFAERALAEVQVDVILVVPSWGGVVITQAGNNEKVKALVYVAAYAPGEGQSIESIGKDAHEVRKIPNVRGLADPIISDGYIRLKEGTVINHFEQDLSPQKAKLIAAGQGRFHISTISVKVTNPAWKNQPGFFIVSDHDHIISPQVEAEMAKKHPCHYFSSSNKSCSHVVEARTSRRRNP